MTVTPRVSSSEETDRAKDGDGGDSAAIPPPGPGAGQASRLGPLALVLVFWLLSVAFVIGVRVGVRALDGSSDWSDLAEVAVVFVVGGLLGVVHRGVRSTEEALRVGAIWLTLSIVAEFVGTVVRHGQPWLVLVEDPSRQGFTWNTALVLAWLLAPVLALRRRER